MSHETHNGANVVCRNGRVLDQVGSRPFTLSEFESHLWKVANNLRGPLDVREFEI